MVLRQPADGIYAIREALECMECSIPAVGSKPEDCSEVVSASKLGRTQERAMWAFEQSTKGSGAVPSRKSMQDVEGPYRCNLENNTIVIDPAMSSGPVEVTTKRDGLGLGLSICQSIIAAHRGRIDATRKARGGMRFSVTFPIAQSASGQLAEHGAVTQSSHSAQ
jgi:hypothetical protein